MTSAEFDAAAWVERLARLLPPLAQAQVPYLREYQERYGRTTNLRDGDPPPFPLEDLRLLYDEVRDGRLWGMEARYAPLRTMLDPVRRALLCHPTLERVAVTGRLIGDNDFWMQTLGSGGRIFAGNLIAGLMARASELTDEGFRTAAQELNAFLSPVGDRTASVAPGSLDEACDMFLFFGLSLSGRIELEAGMVLLPFEEVLRFVDRDLVEGLAPRAGAVHGWREVGAVARPFRWRPEFRRRGSVNEPLGPPPPPFFEEAAAFLDLLAVSHSTRVAPIAAFSNCIDESAGRLLGHEPRGPGFYQRWSAEGFSPFDGCPEMRPSALAEVQEVYRCRESARFRRMAPVATRLSEALSRNGRFGVADRVLDVAMSLERMYVLDGGKIGRKLRGRAARFLGTDETSHERIKESVQEVYDVRSDIIHNRMDRLTPERVHSAYVEGFEIARRSLFRILREGPPDSWNGADAVGD